MMSFVKMDQNLGRREELLRWCKIFDTRISRISNLKSTERIVLTELQQQFIDRCNILSDEFETMLESEQRENSRIIKAARA